MNLYAIFGARNPVELDRRVELAFPKHYKIESGQWFVAHESALPADLYFAMKANDDDLFCVICSATRYYGWHDKAVWAWAESVANV